MAQDVVTARDVAAPAEVSHRSQDAQAICEMLNKALAHESFTRTTYSSSVQKLFQQAWAVAAHKHSTQVTIYHLAYALVFDYPATGKELAEYLGTDIDSFAVGCILRILSLGVPTGDTNIVPPAVGAVRWMGKAAAVARKRGRQSELLPEDLASAVLEGSLPASVRGELRRAARVGNARHDAVLGPKPMPSIAVEQSSPRDIIKHLIQVEQGTAPDPDVSNSGPDVADLLTLLEEFEERYNANVNDQKDAFTRIETLIDRRLAPIVQRDLPIDDIMNKLGTIDRRVSAVHEALPRAPSGMRLAVAILAVLTLGVATGLALTLLQPGSSLAQAGLPSAK